MSHFKDGIPGAAGSHNDPLLTVLVFHVNHIASGGLDTRHGGIVGIDHATVLLVGHAADDDRPVGVAGYE